MIYRRVEMESFSSIDPVVVVKVLKLIEHSTAADNLEYFKSDIEEAEKQFYSVSEIIQHLETKSNILQIVELFEFMENSSFADNVAYFHSDMNQAGLPTYTVSDMKTILKNVSV